MKDIFDLLDEETGSDLFDTTQSTEDTSVESIQQSLKLLLEKYDNKDRKRDNQKLSSEIKTFVKAEVAKIKPVQNVIERTFEKMQPVHIEPRIVKSPPQIIKEVRVEVQKEAPKDTRRLVEEPAVDEIKKQLEELKQRFQSLVETIPMMGGSGVIGIPPPEGNETKVLTVVNAKAAWKTGSGSSSSDAYTVSNVTTTRTLNATLTSLDELASVVGSLITSLKGAGIIQ